MSRFGDKVLSRREYLGLTQPALAELVGLSYQAIQQIEAGSTKSTRRLLQLARALQVSPEWLVSDDSAPPPAPESKEPAVENMSSIGHINSSVTIPDVNIQAMTADVPTFAGAICGDNGLFEFNAQVLDYVKRPPRLIGVRDAYALYVLGDSMARWRKHGDLVFVHPHQPVSPGDYVVVQLKQERDGGPIPAYIKQLVRRTAGETRLAQFHPEKEFSISAKKIWKIHRIVDWSELLGL